MSDYLPDELGVFYFRTILWNSGAEYIFKKLVNVLLKFYIKCLIV